jgi:hypothetical protein
MSVTYRGNCNFAETPGTTLSVDAFGVDYIRRTFIGRTDKEAAFLRAYPRHKPDSDYKTLTFTNATVARDGAFSTVELAFSGLLNGEVPDPVFSYGTSAVENQLEAIDGRVTSLEYRAPTMTVSYVSRDVPRRARYGGVLVKTLEGFKIMATRGAVADDYLNATAARDAAATARLVALRSASDGANFTGFLYDVEIISSAWSVNQAGLLWTVQETNEGRIVQHQVGSVKVDFEPGIFTGGSVIVR